MASKVKRFNVTGKTGETWQVNLDSLTIGILSMLNGNLDKQCGLSASNAVLFRRAMQLYWLYIQEEVKTHEDWQDELDCLIKAGGKDPEYVRQKAGIERVGGMSDE